MQHNKTLIAAAILAGLGMGTTAANAAESYGKLHLSFGQTKQDTTSTGGASTTSNQFKSHASRFGLKDKKALDNGMEVIGQIEFEIDGMGDVTSTKNDTTGFLKSRNTFIGLKGGFGTVLTGIHDTPHKMATSKVDPFTDTYADYNNIITVANRLGNVIAYLNNFGPVGVAGAYYAGNDSVTGENTGDATSVMVNYSGGPLYLAAAVESYAADNVALTDELKSATVFGASYKFGPAELGVAYEVLAYETRDDEKETYVSGKFKVAEKVKLNAAYGKRSTAAANDAVMTAVGVDYKLDKSAKLYAMYANGKDGGLSHKGKLNGDGTAFVLGAIYKF
jgi:predicted porin